ncbi:MAG TPA: hypothetical protein VG711_02675, partial [Phycisphaerales bacterium]|nr:hypothetical protein [Phycisphaerales bacterium]
MNRGIGCDRTTHRFRQRQCCNKFERFINRSAFTAKQDGFMHAQCIAYRGTGINGRWRGLAACESSQNKREAEAPYGQRATLAAFLDF